MGDLIVHETTDADLRWAMETSAPRLRIDDTLLPPNTAWTTGGEVDPFPAYPHDRNALTDAVAIVMEAVRGHMSDLRWDVHLVSAHREALSRSNGHSQLLNPYDYDADNKHRPLGHAGFIFLAGKRIPPHPAMTRHLVAHELGHNVEWMLQDARGEQEYSDLLVREYIARRGLPDATLHHGAGGTWHDSVHEIFACDFRILICGVEPEYWPHPGVLHPYGLPGMREWWGAAMDLLNAPAVEVAAA